MAFQVQNMSDAFSRLNGQKDINPILSARTSAAQLAELQNAGVLQGQQIASGTDAAQQRAVAQQKQAKLQQILSAPGALGPDGTPTDATFASIAQVDPDHAGALLKAFGKDPNTVSEISNREATRQTAADTLAETQRHNQVTESIPKPIDPNSAEGVAAAIAKSQGEYHTPPAPRNIDPNSPEGIAAAVEKERLTAPYKAQTNREGMSYSDLNPKDKARVDAVAAKVAAGEYTIANGLSALGGVRGGLGGALTESLSDDLVVPTAVRTANSDIERAKNLMVPVHQLVDEINKTKDLQQKIILSARLENYVSAIGTQFARAKGERGVVTDRDVSRVLGLIPGWKSANFAPQYAADNLKLVEDAFNRDQSALLGKYFTKFQQGGTASPSNPISASRPRASDGKGNFVEWDGKAWVPVKP
jgi:hypothetical protein